LWRAGHTPRHLRLIAVDICRIRLKRQQLHVIFACRNAKET
jgi:hypothetical protein